MVRCLELAQKLIWASQIFVIPHTVQTSLLQDSEPAVSFPNHPKSWIPWIPFPTIQNHALDVSSGLACF
jgi:hypothetical protein